MSETMTETMTETVTEKNPAESRPFEADVAKLLQLMVHSVYSEKSVFLRELISNAADACERLRYEAIAAPALLGDDAKPRITLTVDAEKRQLMVEDNGIGMSRDEMIEALGTIARSGTKAFIDRLEAAKSEEETALIGRFGVGFYSAFMVAERVEVFSRRAGTDAAYVWSSDGKGSFAVSPAEAAYAPLRGTRVVLHLMEDAKSYTERATLERLIRAQSGHVPVPIAIMEKPGAELAEITDGAALWAKPKSAITAADYTDFYRSIAGQFDEPAHTIHFHAEGRHDYTSLLFVPGSRPFDLFDPDRKGRIKLYVKRIFITDDADILPRYLRFIRGLVDSADLPLNVSREKIQESPLLAAIRKGATSRVLAELERLADKEPEAYTKIWDLFGVVLKEGVYEDFERRDALLALARFKTTGPADTWRSLKDYVAAFKPNQTAIYYLAGDDLARLKSSPHLEGFRARGIEVLLLADPVELVLGDVGTVIRRQAAEIGDAGRGRPRGHSITRCQGSAGARARGQCQTVPGVHEEHARRHRRRGARVRTAHRQRRLSGRRRCRTGSSAGADSGRRWAAEQRLEADPRGQSAASACDRARRSWRRSAHAEGRRRLFVARRGAGARRRPAGRSARVFRAPGAGAGEERGEGRVTGYRLSSLRGA